ncbi:hypothetical protein GLYMA_12G096450v4 [Glycine max]|nr:hypothetical protein GLYMA_12G096450v4 [Glycine max]KAH1142428.1 hypothetical protein GYH30_033219 [Glycine max]
MIIQSMWINDIGIDTRITMQSYLILDWQKTILKKMTPMFQPELWVHTATQLHNMS